LAADAVALIPLAFVRCVAFGGVRVWRGSRRVGFHLPAAAWGALIECAGGLCPLTPLEHHLRPAVGQIGYTGGFIDHALVGCCKSFDRFSFPRSSVTAIKLSGVAAIIGDFTPLGSHR